MSQSISILLMTAVIFAMAMNDPLDEHQGLMLKCQLPSPNQIPIGYRYVAHTGCEGFRFAEDCAGVSCAVDSGFSGKAEVVCPTDLGIFELRGCARIKPKAFVPQLSGTYDRYDIDPNATTYGIPAGWRMMTLAEYITLRDTVYANMGASEILLVSEALVFGSNYCNAGRCYEFRDYYFDVSTRALVVPMTTLCSFTATVVVQVTGMSQCTMGRAVRENSKCINTDGNVVLVYCLYSATFGMQVVDSFWTKWHIDISTPGFAIPSGWRLMKACEFVVLHDSIAPTIRPNKEHVLMLGGIFHPSYNGGTGDRLDLSGQADNINLWKLFGDDLALILRGPYLASITQSTTFNQYVAGFSGCDLAAATARAESACDTADGRTAELFCPTSTDTLKVTIIGCTSLPTFDESIAVDCPLPTTWDNCHISCATGYSSSFDISV